MLTAIHNNKLSEFEETETLSNKEVAVDKEASIAIIQQMSNPNAFLKKDKYLEIT